MCWLLVRIIGTTTVVLPQLLVVRETINTRLAALHVLV